MTSAVPIQSLAVGVELVAGVGGAVTLGASRPVYVYTRGTTNQVTVYSDQALTITLAQPLVTDGSGAIPGYVAGVQAIDIVDVTSGKRTQAEALDVSDLIGSDGKIGGLGSLGLPAVTLSNPMTTSQDLIVGAAGGAAIRLPGGSAGQQMMVRSDGTIGYVTTVINAKAWGAKGDGATDDSTALANAINAAKLVGGRVYCPQGTYITAKQTIYSNVQIVGDGVGATILKLKNGTNDDLIQGDQFATLTGGSAAGITEFALMDLTLDGNKANNTSGYGLRVYGYHYTLERVVIRNCASDGLYSEWNGTAANDQMEAFIGRVKVHDNAGNGIVWNGPHDSHWLGVFSFLNAAKGVWVKSHGTGLMMTNVHSWGIAQTYAGYFEAQVFGTSCYWEGATVAQIMVGASDCQFSNNYLLGFPSTNPAAVGVQLGDSTHTGISGTIIKATKAINLTAGLVDFTREGNGSNIEINAYSGGTLSLGTPGGGSFVSIADLSNGASQYQGGNNAPPVYRGAGTPQFVVPAPAGSIFLRSDVVAGQPVAYIKVNTGGGTGGWMPLTGTAGGVSTSTPGAVTQIAIAHGLLNAPTAYNAQAANANARSAPAFYVTADATNVYLNFVSAIAAATAYSWSWTART